MMKYTAKDIERQLELGEDSNWEFKQVVFIGDTPKKPLRSDLADEIAAFANDNGGTLLLSVSGDGTVIDLSRSRLLKLDHLLVEVSTDLITPPVRIRTQHVKLSDHKKVLNAEIPKVNIFTKARAASISVSGPLSC